MTLIEQAWSDCGLDAKDANACGSCGGDYAAPEYTKFKGWVVACCQCFKKTDIHREKASDALTYWNRSNPIR